MEKWRPNGYGSSQYSAVSGESDISPNYHPNDNVQNQTVPSLRSNTFSASWQPNPVETGWQSRATGTGWQPRTTRTGWQTRATETGWQSGATGTGWQARATGTGWQARATGTGWQSRATGTGWQPRAPGNGWQQDTWASNWQPNVMPSGSQQNFMANASQQNAMAYEWTETLMASDCQPSAANTTWQAWKMAASQQPNTMAPGKQACNFESHEQTYIMPTGFQVSNVPTSWQPTTKTETGKNTNSMQTSLLTNTTAISSQSSALTTSVDTSILTASGDSCPSTPEDNTDQPLSISAALDKSPADNTPNTFDYITQLLETEYVWCKHCFPQQQVEKTGIHIHNINNHIDVLLISAKSTYLSKVEFENFCEYVLNNRTYIHRKIKNRDGNPMLRCKICQFNCALLREMRFHIHTSHEDLLKKELTQLQQDAVRNPELRVKINMVEPKLDCQSFCYECVPRLELQRGELPSHTISFHLDSVLISSKLSTTSLDEFQKHCDMLIQNHIVLLQNEDDISIEHSLYGCQLCRQSCYGRSQMETHVFTMHEQILREEVTEMQQGATNLTNRSAENVNELKPTLDKFDCKDCKPIRCSVLIERRKQHDIEHHIEKLFIQYKPARWPNLALTEHCDDFIENEIASCNALQSVLQCPYCCEAIYGENNMRRHFLSEHLRIIQEKFAQYFRILLEKRTHHDHHHHHHHLS